MGTVPAPNIVADIASGQRGYDDSLQEFQRAAQLKQQAQQAGLEMQAQQQQNQIRAQQMKDQDALTRTIAGFDPEKDSINDLPKKLVANGGSGSAALQAQQGMIQQRRNLASLSDEQFAQEQRKADLIAGVHDAVTQAPAEQKQQVYQEGLQRLAAAGVNVNNEPTQYPGDDIFSQHLPAIRLHSAIVEEARKDRETAAKEQEAQAKVTGAQTTAQRLQAELPGGPLEDPSKAELADWLKKNPGKGASDFLAWKAKQTPLAQIAVANAAGGGMDQGAIDQAAEYNHSTGKLPPGGRGAAGLAQNHKIMNRAAELYPGSLSEGTAEYASNKKSLEALQKNFDQVTAFENTAGKNLDTFLNTAKDVVDFGSPLVNMPLRRAAELAGGKDQAAFNAARTTALTEIAKVLNSSNASGVLSDSARHEVEQLIGPNASLKQIYSAAQILKQDMANRHQSYQDQIADIQKRLPGKKASDNGKSGAATSGVIYARDPQGKLHQAPAGTPLPQGWKQEQRQ